MAPQNRTKIVCTLGPSTHTAEMIASLAKAGMDVCRLNFSHGTHADHAKLIQMVREAAKASGEPLAILQDLQGPKIRVGDVPEDGIRLVPHKEITLTGGVAMPPVTIPVSYPDLHKDVQVGQVILFDDGLLSAKVVAIKGTDVVAEVVQGGQLLSHKGLNLPNTKTSIPALTDKDREDVTFGVEQGVDWMALSFVRSPQDIRDLREELAKHEKPGEPGVRIMVKVEKPEALECLDDIIKEADGIMVARGDLGIEIPAEKVPVVQKRIIEACLRAAKPVVVATQMLESMMHHPRATRAEVSDVAHAVMDHADATMLSGETASGEFPLEAVKTMDATQRETEASAYDNLELHAKGGGETNIASVLARAKGVKAVVVATKDGGAAQLVSRYRPEVPIYAVTSSDRVARQLLVSWGVFPSVVPACATMPELVDAALATLTKQKCLAKGDEIILVAGGPLGTSGSVDLVEERKV